MPFIFRIRIRAKNYLKRRIAMKRFMFVFSLLVVMAYIPMATFNIAQGQCREKASCYSPTDAGNYILDYDGPYTPCDNTIAWSVSFSRTVQSGYPNTIRVNITGDLFLLNYYSEDYSSGAHNFSGNQYVGTSTQTLYLKRIGSNTGNFSEIKVDVTYYADDPD
jgi:hypothetical protein